MLDPTSLLPLRPEGSLVPALKIAVQLRSLRLPFKKALAVAAQWGAEGIEIDARGEINPQDLSQTGIRQVRKLLDDHRLRVAAVEFHTRRGYNISDDLPRRVEATKAAMKFAHDLGTSIVCNQVGRVPEDDQSPGWRLLLEVLSDLGAYGQRVGATLAAETGSESGPQLARLIAAVPKGSLAVTLDPGNLIINGFSPHEAIETLASDIIHVHARDGVRDLAQGRGIEVALGRGSADFPALLGALEERQYRGYFSIERESSSDPIVEIGESIEYLRSL
jgi:sugar phosphate isomerase/epimerase